jgi:hypothetical protein
MTIMGSLIDANTPKLSAPPPAPELKKVTDADARKARDATRQAAISRFGAAGTDITKGSLSGDATVQKKSKLGGG